MLGRPCAFFTTSSGSSNPCSRAHPAHARATAGVESTSTPSRSNSKPRHCIGIIFSMIIGTGRRFFGNRLTLEETSQGRGVWGGRRGLNPRHSVPQTDALPAELLPPLASSLPRHFAAQTHSDTNPPAAPSAIHRPSPTPAFPALRLLPQSPPFAN